MHVGKIAKHMANQQENHFSANTQVNPKGHCKYIITREGTMIENEIGDNLDKENEKDYEERMNQKEKKVDTKLSYRTTLRCEGEKNNVDRKTIYLDTIVDIKIEKEKEEKERKKKERKKRRMSKRQTPFDKFALFSCTIQER